MNWMIRKMKEYDIPAVQAIAKKTWSATYEGIIPSKIQENFLNAAYSTERMIYRLNHSLLLVAEVKERVVGFANYTFVNSKGEAELGAIYIYPEFQGAGIGTALLVEGVNELEGIKEIYIDVEEDNEIGKTFYEARGFQVVRTFEDDFDGHLLNTIRMVWHV